MGAERNPVNLPRQSHVKTFGEVIPIANECGQLSRAIDPYDS